MESFHPQKLPTVTAIAKITQMAILGKIAGITDPFKPMSLNQAK
jgi:hypothetical protein